MLFTAIGVAASLRSISFSFTKRSRLSPPSSVAALDIAVSSTMRGKALYFIIVSAFEKISSALRIFIESKFVAMPKTSSNTLSGSLSISLGRFSALTIKRSRRSLVMSRARTGTLRPKDAESSKELSAVARSP